MKIPHVLFQLINLVMIALLRSPLHGLFSSSILALRYTGVKSGRSVTVPARYYEGIDGLVVITSKDTAWWPNFVGGRQAKALVQGKWIDADVQATLDNPNLTGPAMRELWARHPGDAAYLNVKMHNGQPDPDDFAKALDSAVLISVARR
jgi:hypothetical protein